MSYFQTNYAEQIGTAYAGMLADTTTAEVISASAAVSDIRYGSAVSIEPLGPTSVVTKVSVTENTETSGLGDRFFGVAVREHVREGDRTPLVLPFGDGETSYIKPEETVSVLKRGRIWVELYEDVWADREAYIYYNVAAPTEKLGAFGMGTDAVNTIAVASTGSGWFRAKFVTSGSAGGLAVLEIK